MLSSDKIWVQNGATDPLKTINEMVESADEENAFYVCDIDDIIQKYRMWKAVMPRVKPHYAVKCNDHPVVLKVLAALGLGFDCASKNEIEKVLKLKVEPERIIYAHTTKPPSHLRHAVKSNVRLMTFDNEMELHKIKEICPHARAVIRIKYDSKNAMVVLGTKFGCDHKTEAPYLLHVARSLGINVVGVSFHVGSGCNERTAFHGAIEAARYVFDAAAEIGYNFDLLDIGGGYPGTFDDSIKKYGKIINSALDQYFPNTLVKVISEPGTYFVGSAFTLVCNVHSSKKIVGCDPVTGKPTTRFMYYINDGVYGSLSNIITYNSVIIPKPLKNYPNSETYLSTVWGPTCDSVDHIIADIELPEMKLGDWVVFTDMGAYTISIATSFNGFLPPHVSSIISQNNWLLLQNRSPFLEKDFIIPFNNQNNEQPPFSSILPKGHYNFPQTSFIRG